MKIFLRRVPFFTQQLLGWAYLVFWVLKIVSPEIQVQLSHLPRLVYADSFASTGQGIVGTNMFAYVNSDPVNCIDADGKTIEYITSLYEDTLPIDSTTKATIS